MSPLCVYDTGEIVSPQNTFKKNYALLIVRKKSREEREREEALAARETNERSVMVQQKDFALHGFRTLDDVPEWHRAPRDVAVVLEL